MTPPSARQSSYQGCNNRFAKPARVSATLALVALAAAWSPQQVQAQTTVTVLRPSVSAMRWDEAEQRIIAEREAAGARLACGHDYRTARLIVSSARLELAICCLPERSLFGCTSRHLEPFLVW